jgi:hypothetical protein
MHQFRYKYLSSLLQILCNYVSKKVSRKYSVQHKALTIMVVVSGEEGGVGGMVGEIGEPEYE